MSKKILMIAGPNGAGKATFARSFLPNEAQRPRFWQWVRNRQIRQQHSRRERLSTHCNPSPPAPLPAAGRGEQESRVAGRGEQESCVAGRARRHFLAPLAPVLRGEGLGVRGFH
jgi:hypothetical protein